jgi:hypothetical protein
MMKQSKSSSSSSSSSLIVDMDFEYADSQSNIAPLNAVLDSRGMEIVPVVEEINRPFSDYLEEEIFNDNPDALPNYLILSAINERNEDEILPAEEIQPQPPVAVGGMHGMSLIAKLGTEWIFKDASVQVVRTLFRPFFLILLFAQTWGSNFLEESVRML